jgi:glycerol-3-phosphate dehydrogenase
LVEKEWAKSAEDILWRRSKLGLRVSREAVRAIEKLLTKTGATNAAYERVNSRVTGPDLIPL